MEQSLWIGPIVIAGFPDVFNKGCELALSSQQRRLFWSFNLVVSLDVSSTFPE